MTPKQGLQFLNWSELVLSNLCDVTEIAVILPNVLILYFLVEYCTKIEYMLVIFDLQY